MKMLAALTLILMTSNAFANTKVIEREVLQLLVTESASISLVDEEGKRHQEDLQLPSLITGHLLMGYLTPANKSSSVLGNVSVKCEDTTPATIGGGASYSCSVSFMDGDFRVSKGGSRLEGPETESAIIFSAEVTKAGVPGAKPKLKSKRLVAFLAG